ncbi:flagella assembly protein FlgT middle domain-containing protein [Marinobacter sp. CHS3-4]|uniref:flagella assembly protein FlgT middle domain-containing protein n=1 Tax=Marinobacter sp. CHS3-4 TaxID=3045174 RepID=UPI0024B58DAB|nr:flagella assembly protein FlgT middle domain-containing protein [Marinobacter sp. CHS3-4]MDI9244474.1 flagella assembly protein FlgT middle domain-containing protein [Marinobacter sp. CHS3-4]
MSPKVKYKLLHIVVLIALSFFSRSPLAEESFIKRHTEGFLSDRSRVGAVVGGILASAAYAHPFSPLAGTIAGYILGKSTDFSDKSDSAADFYARKSFAPGADSEEGADAVALNMSGGDSGQTIAFDDSARPGSGSSQSLETAQTAARDSVAYTPNLIISKDVGGRQAELDRLAAIIRKERSSTPFEVNQQCQNQQASRIRKKIVVAGFNLQHPNQAVFGGLGTVSQAVNDALYQNLLNTGEVLPFAAPGRQMFASLESGASRSGWGNRVDKYSAVSRQMGAQFVVSGIIRSVDVNRSDSWDSSYASSIKRSLFSADTVRQFVVDVVLHDGYTGQVVSENRYTAAGRWDVPRTGQVSFGSPGFQQTGYGEAVNDVMNEISRDVMASIDCQAMLVPILEVSGKDLLLDVGTRSGLLPGDKMRVVRAESSLQRPDAPPKLWDTGVDLHIHQLSLDTSRAWMPTEGGPINIREGDYAVIY